LLKNFRTEGANFALNTFPILKTTWTQLKRCRNYSVTSDKDNSISAQDAFLQMTLLDAIVDPFYMRREAAQMHSSIFLCNR